VEEVAAAAPGAGDGSLGDGGATATTVAGAPATAPVGNGGDAEGRVRASPLARRIARERGVDLQAVSGTGPGGRIVKADLERAGAPAATTAAPPAETSSAAAVAAVATAKGETTTVKLSRTQQTIARRMAESKATIPEFSLQADVDMEDCVRLRSELKRLSQDERGTGTLGTPTYNDMIVKAAALALREHPRANASYRDGQLQMHSRVNVGVAVAADDALVVPTVFDADEKSLGEIARETRGLAERVRAGTITPPELGGGTFTVSNLGMFGVTSFQAIINPPQAAILSVGTLEPRAVVREGEIVARATMTLTLVCDHRVLYGADAAGLLARIRELLQAPAALTL
jgi:pyruvate dehydrogenase E2 component (dihydrolipoamide acetyltransferase)